MTNKEISYSDGSIEQDIYNAVKNASDVRSTSSIARERYPAEWPFEYHLSPERANLVRPFDFGGLKVLEIGAGMGAISRFVAESCKSLQVVEGTRRRLDVLEQRLRDLRNWTSYCGHFDSFISDEKFDVVLIIGVMEYADVYSVKGGDPYVSFLKRAESFLKEDGCVVLAIENRLGLKYWNAVTEDHTGKPYEGLVGYSPVRKTVRTFSRAELQKLLVASGLSSVQFYYPFPDYKLPRSILSEELHRESPQIFAELAAAGIARDYSRVRGYHFPESVVWTSLASTGLSTELANSFLICAARSGVVPRLRFQGVGSHFSSQRKDEAVTEFRFQDGSLAVTKHLRDSDDFERDYKLLRWRRPEVSRPEAGRGLLTELRSRLANGDADAFFALWIEYIRWIQHSYNDGFGFIRGLAWDLIPANAIRKQDGFANFDFEWELKDRMRLSWFVLRSVQSIGHDVQGFVSKAFGTHENLYIKTCEAMGIKPDLEGDAVLEASAHRDVLCSVPQTRAEEIVASLRRVHFPNTPPVITEMGTSEQEVALRRAAELRDRVESELRRGNEKIAKLETTLAHERLRIEALMHEKELWQRTRAYRAQSFARRCRDIIRTVIRRMVFRS